MTTNAQYTDNTPPRPYWINVPCGGNHKMCRAAIREGRPVHIIPAYEMGSPAIVLATYHYETEADAIEALTNAWENAPIVRNDTDLYDFRHEGLAYKLPVGWIDPTRR